jgi:NhaP-type Na+/H+ and K+/H+ antiporter
MFGGFSFASEVLLGSIAAFYRFQIPETENETSLADFVRARLQEKPKLGDHISFADKRLVIQGMDGEWITRVGLELQFVEPVCPHELVPASLEVPLHQASRCS